MTSDQKKILLVTAKWPHTSESNDGGDSTLNEIIRAVGKYSILDMLCFREDILKEDKIEYVNKIDIVEEDFAGFRKYGLHNGSKFERRIEQAKAASKEIRKKSAQYDLLIIQHVMFILDMAEDKDILSKSILFPMFTGTSYRKAGEIVPEGYLELERRVLSQVHKIITPSLTEKNMLVRDYGVPEAHVSIIPRPAGYQYKERRFHKHNEIRLIYIASVRVQKNHMDALKVVHKLKDMGYGVSLECIGAVQDETIYRECMEYISERGLEENIHFSGNKSREEVYCAIEQSDINISVSLWETFGRGIYEGMVSGLPTVVYRGLECVFEPANMGVYPMPVNNIGEMAEQIRVLAEDSMLYQAQSRKGMVLQSVLATEEIYRLLRNVIGE